MNEAVSQFMVGLAEELDRRAKLGEDAHDCSWVPSIKFELSEGTATEILNYLHNGPQEETVDEAQRRILTGGVLQAHRGSYKTSMTFKMATGIDLQDLSDAQFEVHCWREIEAGVRETARLGLSVNGRVRHSLEQLDKLRKK